MCNCRYWWLASATVYLYHRRCQLHLQYHQSIYFTKRLMFSLYVAGTPVFVMRYPNHELPSFRPVGIAHAAPDPFAA